MLQKRKIKKPISVILLCTLPDQGMKSLGSKSLVKVDKNNTLLEKQIKNIKSGLGRRQYEIIISCCFDCYKVKKIASKHESKYNIEMISHGEENMNFGGALLACIKECKYKDIIFINYGCLFNRNVIRKLSNCEDNKIIVTKKSQRNSHISVGCNIDIDDNINHIFYGLDPYKYMDIGYLNSGSIDFMSSYLYYKKHINKFTFEVVNILIENGFSFNYQVINNQDIVLANTTTLTKYKKVLEV